jgi:hypothetical protein
MNRRAYTIAAIAVAVIGIAYTLYPFAGMVFPP